MRQNDLNIINIEVNAIEDLFIEPEFDPFEPESLSQSGIDVLVNQVRKLSMREPLKIRINLLSQPEDKADEWIVKSALDRYCLVKIRECELEIYELRNQGKRDLIWALTLSFLFFLGAFFATQIPFIPEFVIYLISTGFGILAWVVLWPPLDNLLYEWRPFRRSQQIYNYIQTAKLAINSTQQD
ncbi:hypothetical protein ACFLXI_01555 [Chloroflexota bacterium]